MKAPAPPKPAAARRLPRAQVLQKQTREGREKLEKLLEARDTVALLVCEHPHLSPVFQRLDQEVEIAQAALSDDVLTRARAIARQKAVG